MTHPFRFYNRDYDLQGQEKETFVVCLSDGEHDFERTTSALVETLSAASHLSLGWTWANETLWVVELRYEDSGGKIDYRGFDREVDQVFLAIHEAQPIDAVIHVGGQASKDDWEVWSRKLAEPADLALALLVNDTGWTRWVETDQDGDPEERIELPRSPLSANVRLRLHELTEQQ